jgi:hypothetical protein
MRIGNKEPEDVVFWCRKAEGTKPQLGDLDALMHRPVERSATERARPHVIEHNAPVEWTSE